MLIYDYRNGYIHNRDNVRPATNSICATVHIPAANSDDDMYYSHPVYILENILVNGGNHDTYVLRNIETKKVLKATKIAVVSGYIDSKGKKYNFPAIFDKNRNRASYDNEKTGIISISSFAGCGLYDGAIPSALKDLPRLNGTCNCNCVDENGKPACYAKRLTRYNGVYLKYWLNTLEIQIDPARFMELLEKEIFTGNPLNSPRVMRLHDSGDIASSEYWKECKRLINDHKETVFGSYTKRDDIITREELENIPTNMVLSCSPWKDICKPIGDLPQFIYDDGSDETLETLPHCPAVNKNGERTGVMCKQCLHCYTAKHGERWAVYAH